LGGRDPAQRRFGRPGGCAPAGDGRQRGSRTGLGVGEYTRVVGTCGEHAGHSTLLPARSGVRLRRKGEARWRPNPGPVRPGALEAPAGGARIRADYAVVSVQTGGDWQRGSDLRIAGGPTHSCPDRTGPGASSAPRTCTPGFPARWVSLGAGSTAVEYRGDGARSVWRVCVVYLVVTVEEIVRFLRGLLLPTRTHAAETARDPVSRSKTTHDPGRTAHHPRPDRPSSSADHSTPAGPQPRISLSVSSGQAIQS